MLSCLFGFGWVLVNYKLNLRFYGNLCEFWNWWFIVLKEDKYLVGFFWIVVFIYLRFIV